MENDGNIVVVLLAEAVQNASPRGLGVGALEVCSAVDISVSQHSLTVYISAAHNIGSTCGANGLVRTFAALTVTREPHGKSLPGIWQLTVCLPL